MVIFLDLSKSKIDGYFASFGKVTIFNKTPLGEKVCLGNPDSLLTDCLSIQVFDSTTLFPTQSVRLPLVTYPLLCSTCVTYGTPYRPIRHQFLPTIPLPRKLKDFSRSGKHSKYVFLIIDLAWLIPFINNSRLIFKHVKIEDFLKKWWRV